MKIEAEEAAAKAAKKVEDEFRDDEKKGIALNLIKMNFPDEQIAQATGLSVNEVKKLRTNK
jgi:transcription initiation factor IIE alpha subunit